jgi:peptidoglycan hydrolase CwlO-like protein
MKKATLIAVACALVALAGCNRGNQDQLHASDDQQNLDELSNDAANVASEAQELQNQAANLQNQAEAVDNASGPETPADENIQGM